MQALHLYEVSLCGCGCGYPARETQSEALKAFWSVERGTCNARAALDQDAKGKKETPAGELRWVTPDLPWDRRIKLAAGRSGS